MGRNGRNTIIYKRTFFTLQHVERAWTSIRSIIKQKNIVRLKNAGGTQNKWLKKFKTCTERRKESYLNSPLKIEKLSTSGVQQVALVIYQMSFFIILDSDAWIASSILLATPPLNFIRSISIIHFIHSHISPEAMPQTASITISISTVTATIDTRWCARFQTYRK